jgi:hypothetical protein
MLPKVKDVYLGPSDICIDLIDTFLYVTLNYINICKVL